MDKRLSRIGESTAEYWERRATETRLVQERKVVKRILVGLGVDKVSLGVMRPDYKDDDSSYMTFPWLYDNYPTFPLYLTLRDAWDPSITDFFRVRSRKNSFWPIWDVLTECYRGNSKSIGCVFKFPEISDLGFGIVHNHDLPYQGYTDSDVVYIQRRKMDGTVITLEQLDGFVNRLKTVWDPS